MNFDKPHNQLKNIGIFDLSGGEGGIRTHGTLPRTAVFKTAALNHSATSPDPDRKIGSRVLRAGRGRLHAMRWRSRQASFFVTYLGGVYSSKQDMGRFVTKKLSS